MANKMTGAERKKKFYERSRTGCATCKQRRVRCDEERPKCRNCSRTLHVCVYESAKPPLRERATLRRPGEQPPWSFDKQTSSVAVAAIESPAPSTTSLSTKTLGSLHSFPIEMPLESKNLLNYFASLPNPTSPSPSSTSIQSAINDPCGLRNILIIAAFQHAWKYGSLGIFEQTFLYHKYQTVALVNAHLRPSQFVPFCAEHINTLCFSEFAFGNFNAAEIHVKGMLLYLETRLLESEDQHQSTTDELCDRYFILAYSMAQGVKGRVNEYLAEARHSSQSSPSTQELERLVPKLYSHEAGGPRLCFDTMILLPSFFSSFGSFQKLNPVDVGSILDCIREITSLFDVRKSPRSADQDEKSPYKQWIQGAPVLGGPSRLFDAIVNAHITSTLPMPDGSRPEFQSSWIGLIVVLGMYLISVLGVWNSGLPAEDRLLHYILRSSHRDLSKYFSHSMSNKSKAQEFWFWKLFVTALHLVHARTNSYYAWMDDLDLKLLGFIRKWADLTKTRTWEDARGKLIGIAWPATFDRECLAEALWNKAIGL